jgi:bacillopeptidase F
MRRNGTDYVKIIFIVLFSIFIIGYFIFNFRIFIAGPSIVVTSPQNGEETDKDLVEITGKAQNTNFISINDRPIFVDNEGNFKEFLLLSAGYNIIVIKAQDKFERKISKNIEVISKASAVDHSDIINITEENSSTSTDSGTSTLETDEAAAESNSE